MGTDEEAEVTVVRVLLDVVDAAAEGRELDVVVVVVVVVKVVEVVIGLSVSSRWRLETRLIA